MAQGDDALGLIVGVGVMALGMAFVAAVLDWQLQKDEERRAEERLILDILLNDDAGNVLGDSELSFSIADPIEPPDDDSAILNRLLAGPDLGAA